MPSLRPLAFLTLIFILGGCLPGQMNWSSAANPNSGNLTGDGSSTPPSGKIVVTDNTPPNEETGESGSGEESREEESGGEVVPDEEAPVSEETLASEPNAVVNYGFSSGEMLRTEFYEEGRAILRLADGRVAIGIGKRATVNDPSTCAVMFVKKDAQIDLRFGDMGYPSVVMLAPPAATDCQINTLAEQAGNILIGGWVDLPDGRNFLVSRFRIAANGFAYELDNTFGSALTPGYLMAKPNNVYSEARAFAVRSTGEIIVAGSGTAGGVGADVFVTQLDTSGRTNPSFGNAGGYHVRQLQGMPSTCSANTVLIDETSPDEPGIFIGGELRGSTDGAFLMSVDKRGAARARTGGGLQFFPSRAQIQSMVFQQVGPTKMLLISGKKHTSTGAPSYLARIDLDSGTTDTSFNGGEISLYLSGSLYTNSIGLGIGNGKIIVPAKYLTSSSYSVIYTVGLNGQDLIAYSPIQPENPLAAMVTALGQVFITGSVAQDNTNILFRRQNH